MNTILDPWRLVGLAVLCAAMATAVGCGSDDGSPRGGPSPQSGATTPPAKKASVGSNVTLEVQGERRRVLIDASVCKREGDLELVLTHKGPQNKSHESILWADVDARKVHEALLMAKAVPGSPVQYDPFREAQGQQLKVLLRYEQDGKQHTVPAQSWLRTLEGKPVNLDWVFAGSILMDDPFDAKKPKMFLAQNEGALIALGSLESALIDVNVPTGRRRSELDFEYNTPAIPPVGTPVTVILEPVGEYHPHRK
jgi:hypothetical protein